jgi:sulfate permease, SulP family
VTGLVSLESALARLHARGTRTLLVGLNPQPRRALEKAGLPAQGGGLTLCATLAEALEALRPAPPGPGRGGPTGDVPYHEV